MEGIDKIKKLVKVVCDTLLQFEKANADGRITKFEYLGFIDEAIALVGVITNYKALLAQLADLDSDESKELIEYIEKLNVANGDAIIILTHVLSLIDKGYDLYLNDIVPIIEIFKTK